MTEEESPSLQGSIWDKIDPSVLVVPTTAPEADTEVADEAEKPKRRVPMWLYDLAGVAFWIFVFVKLFISDVDRSAVENLAPGARWLVDYRFFILLAFLILAVIFIKRTWLFLLYILFFPFIFTFWRLPRLVYRNGSWVAFLALLNAAASFVRGFRFTFITWGLALFAVLGIALSTSSVVVVPCALYLLALFMISVWRTLRAAFSFSKFLELQEKLLVGVTDSSIVRTATNIDNLKSSSIVTFSSAQLTEFTNAVSWTIASNRLVYFWAYQLERYRESGVPYLYNVLSYIRLFFMALFTFTMLNLAVYRVNPQQFTFSTPPSMMRMIVYTLSSFVLSGVSGLDAVGDAALFVRLLAGLTGVVLLASLVLNIVVFARGSRQESEFQSTIADLKARAGEIEKRFAADYGVTLDEGYERLQKLGVALANFINFLAARVPDEFMDGT